MTSTPEALNETTRAFRTDGYAALITGAGSGIGRATAIALAEAGAGRLFLCGRSADKLDETARLVEAVAPRCAVERCAGDVTDAGFRRQLAAAVARRRGGLNALVNNAGLFAGNDVAGTSDAEWREVYEVNVAAPFGLLRETLPALAAAAAAGATAAVVNISSSLAIKPIPVAAAYNSAKAALLQLTRSLALELGPRGVRVNALLPAVVETPMYRGRYGTDAEYARGVAAMAAQHPLGRIGRPEDIARAVVYLTSPAASWITGAVLPVDGGMLCT